MIVVDASVAIKWVRRLEEFSANALVIQHRHLTQQEKIIAPQLIYYEVANALVTKSSTTSAYIKKGLNILFETKLSNYEVSEQEILESSQLAKRYKTSVYDMLYAVVAKKNKATLYTADKNFIKKTGFKFVKHISQVIPS